MSKLGRVLPRRRDKIGARPGVTGVGPKGKTRGDQEQWFFPQVELTQVEKDEILATVVKIAARKMFETHIYSFGGKRYKQSGGGRIGLRSTCAVARVAMSAWDNEWLKRIGGSNILLELACRYMDDGRAILYPIRPGWRWCGQELEWCLRWEMEDKALTSTDRTARALEGSMRGIMGFLDFTIETGEQFSDGWLPSLDTNLKVDDKNVVLYKFYQKPMASRQVIHKDTAMAENSKVQSLSYDLTRRLLNTSEDVPDQVRLDIVDDYAQMLLNSGYSTKTTRRVCIAGLKYYERRRQESKIPGGRQLHQSRETEQTKETVEENGWKN